MTRRGRRADTDRAGWAHDEGGNITLWLLGLCVSVLFLGGISIDLWHAFSERRALAGAVDAAAIAGASGLDEQAFREDGRVALDPALAESLAAENLRSQGDLSSLTAWSTTASPQEITVTAAGSVELTLLRVLAPGQGPLRIQVSATVAPRPGR